MVLEELLERLEVRCDSRGVQFPRPDSLLKDFLPWPGRPSLHHLPGTEDNSEDEYEHTAPRSAARHTRYLLEEVAD